MKVIILTGEPFPNGMAAVSRIKCFARAIKESGIDVEVVIWHRTEKFGHKPKNTQGTGEFYGIPFRYISGTPLRGSNVLFRRFNDYRDLRNTEKFIKNNISDGDVLMLVLNELWLEKRFIRAAHKVGAYCVRELCELPYGTGAETAEKVRLRNIILSRVFPQYDGIISISDALMHLAEEYTTKTCRHIKVPIMVDYSHYGTVERSQKVDSPYIFHAGTLSQQKDGILGMLEAFGKAKQRLLIPITYVLTGRIESSSDPEEIKRIIHEYNLDESVRFIGYLNQEQIRDYLGRASLVISNRPKSKQDYYGFSTKVGEYLASGTPLITTNWGEAVNWLKDGESAYIIEPENIEVLAETIVKVFNHPDEARRIGLAGKEVCQKNFDYRNWSTPLKQFISEL